VKHAWRLPAIVVLVGLFVAGYVVQGNNSAVDTIAGPTQLAETVPTASSPGSVSSTWYCAAGTAMGVGDPAAIAEQVVIIANDSETDATGLFSVVPDKGDRAATTFKVAAHSRQVIRVSDVLKAAWASVLVEVTGGEVTVTHELTGPSGRSLGGCASSPDSNWYFPAGTSRAGSRNLVAVFNPFPGEATVDLSFDTDDGVRTPQQFQGLVIPGSRVVVVDVAAVVTLRAHVATTVSARTGRVIAEQLQTTDGRDGTDLGLTAVLGGTTPSPVWVFADGAPAGTTVGESISIFNPGDSDTEVQVQVQLDDQKSNGTVEPFQVTVASRRYATVDLYSDPRVPRSVGHWVIVRSIDDTPVVVERSITGVKGSALAGTSYTMGVPVVATRWLVGPLVSPDIAAGVVSIANPSATESSKVTIRSITARGVVDLANQVAVTVAPGERLSIDVRTLLVQGPDRSFEIVSTIPVSVGEWLQFDSPADFSTPQGFPVMGTQRLLLDAVVPQAGAGLDVDPSLAPDDTSVIPDSSTVTTVVPVTTAVAR
jgi:hypothetical protein